MANDPKPLGLYARITSSMFEPGLSEPHVKPGPVKYQTATCFLLGPAGPQVPANRTARSDGVPLPATETETSTLSIAENVHTLDLINYLAVGAFCSSPGLNLDVSSALVDSE